MNGFFLWDDEMMDGEMMASWHLRSFPEGFFPWNPIMGLMGQGNPVRLANQYCFA